MPPTSVLGLRRRKALERRGVLKLSMQKAREIRRLSAEGMTGRALAERYGVTDSAISDVLTGHSWKEAGAAGWVPTLVPTAVRERSRVATAHLRAERRAA